MGKDRKMTMRYSHLAPEHPQSSLEMLVPSSQLVIGYRQEEAKGRKDLGEMSWPCSTSF